MAASLSYLSEQTRSETKKRLEEPPMYRVMLYNDDFTTKEFVVQILIEVFHKASAEATELMWRIHRMGRGVAGVFSREIAETKAAAVKILARENEFPLRIEIEPDP